MQVAGSDRHTATAAADRACALLSGVERPLRCVWRSYPDHEHDCRAQIPLATVAAAWRRELARGRAHGGFFNFAWRGEAWLAYGLPNGEVRGVYCPEHRAGREERLGYDPELVRPAAVPSIR